MYRHLIILPDGTNISSGRGQKVAIQSVEITEQVNSQQELTLGSVCSTMVDATLIIEDTDLALTTGDKITVYRIDENGSQYLVGNFYLEEPTKVTAHKMRLIGFDSISKLDRDLTAWLASLSNWPYTVAQLSELVCEECGLTFVNNSGLNLELYIYQFTADAVTGRHLMQWLGQIAGCFCRATLEGKIEFAWYVPNDDIFISPSGQDGSIYYFQNQLSYSDYQVQPVEKVQLRQSSEDIGTIFPNEEGEKNTYIIENNPMLAARDAAYLVEPAEALYNRLSTVTYTPFRVQIPSTLLIGAGDILSIVDAKGNTISVYVMKKTSNGQFDILEGSGSYCRNSSTAVNTLSYKALSGKVLNLRADVDGIKAENKDTQGRLALLNLDLNGIQAQVSQQQAETDGMRQSMTSVEQTAQGLSVSVQNILDNGVDKIKTGMGYTFNDDGLRISRDNSDIENKLDHTGMYVSKRGENVLQATADGVKAVDITVKNYLVVGAHARFEDYSDGSSRNRTACFYIE